MTDKEVERLIEKRAENCAAKAPDTENAPELLYFSGIVKKTRQRIKRRQNIQFAVFIAVALIIVAVMMLFIFANIAIFAIVQAVPLAVFCILRLRAHLWGQRDE